MLSPGRWKRKLTCRNIFRKCTSKCRKRGRWTIHVQKMANNASESPKSPVDTGVAAAPIETTATNATEVLKTLTPETDSTSKAAQTLKGS
jgi:hypothetical protein